MALAWFAQTAVGRSLAVRNVAPPLGFEPEHGSPPGPPESPAPREDKKKKRDEDSTGGGGASTPKRNKAKAA